MIYLFRKMRRDLWKLKGQFLAVIIMTLLCVMVYSGIEGLWKSMELNSQVYFEENNLADAWIKGILFSNEDLDAIRDIEDVQEAELLKTVDGISSHNNKDAELKIITFDNNKVSQLYIMEGVAYDKSLDGCWLDSFYADAMDINVGEVISLEYDSAKVDVEVVGIVMNPEYIGYTGPASTTPTDHESYGYAVIGNGMFEELLNQELGYNQIRVSYIDGVDQERARQKIADELEEKMLSYIGRETNSNIVYFTSKIDQVKQISILFSSIFLLLALLTIYSTISRLVSTQNVQIGTLSAMGFTKKQILIHYANYGLLMSAIGVIVGYGLACFLSDMLIASQKKFHALPNWETPLSWTTIVLMVFIVLICTIAALSASYRYVVRDPAATMKNELKLKIRTETRIKAGFLSYEWKWVLRDLQRSKLRFLIGVIGVFGSIVLLISAIGLRDSVEYSNQYVYGEQFSYAKKLGITSTADLSSIETLDDKGQWLEEVSAEIRIDDQIETTNFNIVGEGEFITLWPDMNDKFGDEEIVIAQKLAQRLNIQEGDKIEMKEFGGEEFEEYKVTKIIETPFPQGLYCSQEYWENKGKEFLATSFLTGESLKKSDHDDFTSEVTIKEQLESTNEIMKSVYTILVAMIAASVLLSIVIIYNLGLLNYTENFRQYATLKVLGFKNFELFKIIFYNSIPSLLIGSVLGGFIGIKFVKVFVGLVSTNVRVYITHLTVLNILLSLLLVVGCTIFVDFIIYKKVKKVDMVEALKSIE